MKTRCVNVSDSLRELESEAPTFSITLNSDIWLDTSRDRATSTVLPQNEHHGTVRAPMVQCGYKLRHSTGPLGIRESFLFARHLCSFEFIKGGQCQNGELFSLPIADQRELVIRITLHHWFDEGITVKGRV